MADDLDDGEFWLPSAFLSEEMGSKSGVISPVESVMGSTETESDGDDFMEGLTRRMAHYTLEDDYPAPCFGSVSHKSTVLATSPQSTLCDSGRRSPYGPSRGSSPPLASWDLLYAAAGDTGRMELNDGATSYYDNNRSLFGAIPSNGSSLDRCNFGPTRYQQMNQQNNRGVMPGKGTELFDSPHLLQNRATRDSRGNNQNSNPLFLSPSAWPPLQHPRKQKQNDEKTQVVFLDAPPVIKKPCVGTGVFFPRRTRTPHDTNTRNKARAVSTAFIPARVVEALNLNLEEISFQIPRQPPSQLVTRSDGSFCPASDVALNLRSNICDVPQLNCNPGRQPAGKHNQEILLPQEWTY